MDAMGSLMDLETLRAMTNLNQLVEETGCSGTACDVALQEFTEHPKWFCDGTPTFAEGGNFKGHVFPGVLFIIWASHWLFSHVRGYFECKLSGRTFEVASCQRGLWFPHSWPLEAAIKSTLPCIAILLELWLAHPGGYRYLQCPDGSKLAGHFWGNHLNNWAHAAMYIGIIISGIVDLLHTKIALPKGTGMAFLALAFLEEALLMGLHKKHSPLDVMVHVLLTSAMLQCSVFSLLEVVWPHNFMLSMGRIASVYLQGFFFIGAGHVLYAGLPRWNPADDDLAPTMNTPLVYAMQCVVICAMLFAAWLLGYYIYMVRPEKRAFVLPTNVASKPEGATSSHAGHQL